LALPQRNIVATVGIVGLKADSPLDAQLLHATASTNHPWGSCGGAMLPNLIGQQQRGS